MKRHGRIGWLVMVLGCGWAAGCGGQRESGQAAAELALARAHAHNDYAHARPLRDALAEGFNSVEADIHLTGGELLVAHDAEEVQADRTLQRLYLEPLRERVRANGGRVFRGGPEFFLWIDIKTEGVKTYGALREVLTDYEDMLSVVREGKLTEGAIRVIISGNRPREMMRGETMRYAGLDGRLEDLESEEPAHFMPWISDRASRVSRWRGEGPLPAADREKLYGIIRRAHARGRKVRLWGTPDTEAVWQALLEAGVDVINTDDLRGLREFLLKHDNGIAP